MATKVLVTGGAGFIGSHLVDRLLEEGFEVTVYDSLEKQVHGEEQKVPDYLAKDAEFIEGDVRDRDALCRAIKGKQVVFHEAAAVGVGQSMYEIARYTEINTMGGAILLDILANEKHQVEKVLVASSMSIYGEGKYDCPECGVISPKIKWSPDGLRFRDAGDMPNQSTGLFSPDADSDPDNLRGFDWGLEVYTDAGARGLRRFDCMPAAAGRTFPFGQTRSLIFS